MVSRKNDGWISFGTGDIQEIENHVIMLKFVSKSKNQK